MAVILPSHVVPPPYQITEDDKRGLVIVITTLTLSFAIVCLTVRVYVRTRVNEWKRDDSLLAITTIFCCLQAACVYVQVKQGLGLRQLEPAKLASFAKANFGQQFFFIFTLFLSKCVVLLLYLRLTAGRTHAMLAYTTIGLCAAWTVLSFVLVSIPCNPVAFFTQGVEVCGNPSWRWVIIGVTDIVTEVIIFLNAIYLVAGLHMSFRLKTIVVLAFSIRLPVIIASAIRTKYIHSIPSSLNPAFASAYSVVAGQFELDFAIMASTISCIGPFLRPFEADGGTSSYHQRYAGYPSAGRSHDPGGRSFNDQVSFGTAIRMGPVAEGRHKGPAKRGISSRRSSAAIGGFASRSMPEHDGPDLRPDFFAHEAGAARCSTADGGATEADQLSMDSNDSKRMIINKKTTVRVERDGEEEGLGNSVAVGRASAYSRG